MWKNFIVRMEKGKGEKFFPPKRIRQTHRLKYSISTLSFVIPTQ